MAIYIKGINAPKDCDSCDIVKDCPLWYCTDIGARHPECPITEVKEPHGDLIERDRLLTERMKAKYYHLDNGDVAIPMVDIRHAPTVIERSEGDTTE